MADGEIKERWRDIPRTRLERESPFPPPLARIMAKGEGGGPASPEIPRRRTGGRGDARDAASGAGAPGALSASRVPPPLAGRWWRAPEKSSKKVSPALWWGHRPTYNPHEGGDRRTSGKASRRSPGSHCPMSVPRHSDVGMNPKREKPDDDPEQVPRHLGIETTSRWIRRPQLTFRPSCTMREAPVNATGAFRYHPGTHSARQRGSSLEFE